MSAFQSLFKQMVVAGLPGIAGALQRWLPVSAMVWQVLHAPGYGCFFAAAFCDRPKPVNGAGGAWSNR